jgi:hypothetical protein
MCPVEYVTVGDNEWPRFALHIFINEYVLIKKIHHRMQREKLYNLHRTVHFTVVIFPLKIDKMLSDQSLTLRHVFAQNSALFEIKSTQLR